MKVLQVIGGLIALLVVARFMGGSTTNDGMQCQSKTQGVSVLTNVEIKQHSPGNVKVTCQDGSYVIVSHETDPLKKEEGIAKKVTIESSISSNRVLIKGIEGLERIGCFPTKDSLVESKGGILMFEGKDSNGNNCTGEL